MNLAKLKNYILDVLSTEKKYQCAFHRCDQYDTKLLQRLYGQRVNAHVRNILVGFQLSRTVLL